MTARLLLSALLVVGSACGRPTTESAPGTQSPSEGPSTIEGPASPPASEPAGSCDVLDVSVVSEAAGTAMRVVSPPGSRGCALVSEPPGLLVEGMVLPRTAVFDEIASHEAAEAIEGVENGYYVQVDGNKLGQLHVARGETMFVATLRAEGGADLRGIAGRLAPRVASSLGSEGP